LPSRHRGITCDSIEVMVAIPKRAILGILGTVAYLGLAVAGWGGIWPFFSHPALIAVAIVFLALTIVSLFSEGNISSGVREDRSNRWVLAVLGVLSILSAYLSAYTDRKDIWVLDGDTVRWLGVALLIVGGFVRLWPVFVLGKRFSGLVAIQPGHTLVTTGIYGVVRNPSYVGLLMTSFGWGLAFRSAIGVILTALMFPAIVARINSEERLLLSQFGDEYEAYRRHTWRLVPGLY
jgi:protein-S-isoprenylcysteine O-methyltransferase Ste14